MKRKNGKVIWEQAPDIKNITQRIIKQADLKWIDKKQLFYFRSYNSSARAYARIWGLGRVWQLALGAKPSYVIEVISEKFDRLEPSRKEEVLVHELTHIPKNFSGSLMPHIRKRGKRNFHDKVQGIVNRLKRR